MSKITPEIEKEIIQMYDNRLKTCEISNKFNIPYSTIQIFLKKEGKLKGKSESHLKMEITTEIKQKIIELYKNGFSSHKIAEQFPISQPTIVKILKENNIVLRRTYKERRNFTPEEINIICDMYKNRICSTEIGNKFGVSRNVIRNILLKNNIQMRTISESQKERFKYKKHPRKDVIVPIETRNKMSESRKGKYVGETAPRYNIPFSEESKNKISESLKELYKIHPEKIMRGKNHPMYGRCKELHPCWKGGITPIKIQIRDMPEYINWRTSVFERDSYTCQDCGISNIYLEAHHIKYLSQILDEYDITTTDQALNCNELWDINNGKTLCKKCHNMYPKYFGG